MPGLYHVRVEHNAHVDAFCATLLAAFGENGFGTTECDKLINDGFITYSDEVHDMCNRITQAWMVHAGAAHTVTFTLTPLLTEDHPLRTDVALFIASRPPQQRSSSAVEALKKALGDSGTVIDLDDVRTVHDVLDRIFGSPSPTRKY